MNRKTLAALLVLALVTFAACGDDHANSNHSNANTARSNANGAARTNANDTADRGIDWNVDEEGVKNKAAEYRAEAGKLKDNVADNASDLWAWTQVRAALAKVDDLDDSKINVDVENGVVTLRGTVSGTEKTKAGGALIPLRDQKKIKDFKNNLSVAS